MLSSWNVLMSTTSLLSFHFMIIRFLRNAATVSPFLVLPSSQNLGTLFYWSSWFKQHLFFWYIRHQQDLDWCTSCPVKDSSPYQVGHGLPPAQSLRMSFLLGVSDHKWYPYQCILWSSKHSLCCFCRVCRFSLQTSFALMVCTESNPVVLSRVGETHRHRCFVLVCIRRKTWILGDQGLVGFYRASAVADQGQIWNCRQVKEL